MKPIRQRLGFLVALLIAALPAFAQTFQSEGVFYKVLNTNSVEVTKASGTATSYSGDIVIPETVTNNGATYTVTAIGDAAFDNCNGVTSVILPKSILKLGFAAFRYSGINSIVLPDALTNINGEAFYGCSKLTDVKFGASLQSIGSRAFAQSGITSAVLPDALTVIGENSFINARALKTVILGNAVTTIGNSAFRSCDLLEEITLPETLNEIAYYAFGDCGLKQINIPENVSKLGEYVFANCDALTEAKLPSQLKAIPNGLFSGCKSLVTIDIPDAVTSLGRSCFYDCKAFTEAPIGQNVESIGESVFENCTSLTVVNIPDKVTSLGNSLFRGCTNLESLTIGDGLTNIPIGLVGGCNKLRYLSLGNGITTIDSQAFLGCNALETVILPESLISIGKQAFSGCTALSEITFPASLQTIEQAAFANCFGLKNIVIPDGVTELGIDVFGSCRSLQSATLGNGLTSVSSMLFSSCSALTNVTFGSNIKTIENGAFSSCKALKQVSLPEGLTTIGQSAFSQSGLTEIIIPDKVTTIGASAFNETPLTTVTIPASVTTIGGSAFYRCNSLVDIWCYATTPPVRDGQNPIFGSSFNYNNCTLHIPYPTKPLYQANEDWKNFLKIKEIGKILITKITLDKTEASMPIGTELTLKATIEPDNASEKDLSWMSTNEEVATVDQNGKVTAVAKGTVQIKAMATDDSNVEAVCSINVISLVKEIKLSAAETSVVEGKTLKINATVLPDDANDKTLSWTSSDEKIATVDEEGIVTGVSKGEVVITATANDGSEVKAGITIEVIRLVSKITLDKTEAEVVEGNTLQLTATVEPTDANNTKLVWTSSDETIATVDENGLVTAVSKGTATITAAATDGSGVKAECLVRVLRLVREITLDPTEKTLPEGETFQITATVIPEDADNTKLAWTSSDEAVATVDENGLVTAVSKGTATITATSTDGSNVKAECTVTVVRLVSGITLDKTEAEIIEGNTLQLTATVVPTDANNKALEWTSSDETVATVDANGLVTAVSKGTATITAAATDGSGVKAECAVRVLRLVREITLDPTEKTLPEGETFQITATVIPEDADNTKLAWTSSDEAVATVDANGVVTAVSKGTATITATSTDGSNVKAECAVTVVRLVSGITLDKTEVEVIEGNTLQLTATVVPTDANNKALEWTSSDESVATVDANGLVTAVSKGTATITAAATDGSGVKAECSVRVIRLVSEIVLNPSEKTLAEEETFRIVATVLPADTDNAALTWSSSNEAVATVDANGFVTTLARGTVTITAAATDGSGVTAQCVITVIEKPLDPTLEFDRESYMVYVNDVIDLNESILFTDRPAGAVIVWESSDSSIAAAGTGEDAGKFTGVAPGTVTVTAKMVKNSKVLVSAECTLEVFSPVSKLVIGAEAVTLTPGDTYQLTAVVYGGNGTEINDIVWSSVNPSIVTVDSNGLVTAVAVGTANVYATLPGVLPAMCTVTVTETSGITGIAVDKDGKVLIDGNNIIVPQDARVFTINGIEVQPVNLVSGIYIVCLPDGQPVKVIL